MTDFVKQKESEHYERMTDALAKLHSEGDKNSKFVQDLALKMVEKNPTNKSSIEYIEKKE